MTRTTYDVQIGKNTFLHCEECTLCIGMEGLNELLPCLCTEELTIVDLDKLMEMTI